MKMDKEAVLQQSKQAYKQWCVQWREQAKHHSKYEMKPLYDFENIGIGKACLLIANGYSFEENLETIKKNQDNVDILCCDKTLGHCLENDIIPTYCLVCDANVNYEKYMEKYKDKLQDTVLFINVCANPKWSDNGNWKDKYFFVNKDVMKNEVEFCNLSGCPNTIPAGTNVSNAMAVFLTQSDERGRVNFFGYDKYILIGFDYNWYHDTNYYSFDKEADGKTNYMRHVFCLDTAGRGCYTSNNLAFSATWLDKYIATFKLNFVQGTQRTITKSAPYKELEDQMKYKYKPEDAVTVIKAIYKKNELTRQLAILDQGLRKIAKDHFYAYRSSI